MSANPDSGPSPPRADRSPPPPRAAGRLSAYYLGGTFALAFAIILGMFVYRMITHEGRRTSVPATAAPTSAR